jgi:hypothetical protein
VQGQGGGQRVQQVGLAAVAGDARDHVLVVDQHQRGETHDVQCLDERHRGRGVDADDVELFVECVGHPRQFPAVGGSAHSSRAGERRRGGGIVEA